MCLRPSGRHLQLLPHKLQAEGGDDLQQGGKHQEGGGGHRSGREGRGHPGQHRPGGSHCALPQVTLRFSIYILSQGLISFISHPFSSFLMYKLEKFLNKNELQVSISSCKVRIIPVHLMFYYHLCSCQLYALRVVTVIATNRPPLHKQVRIIVC